MGLVIIVRIRVIVVILKCHMLVHLLSDKLELLKSLSTLGSFELLKFVKNPVLLFLSSKHFGILDTFIKVTDSFCLSLAIVTADLDLLDQPSNKEACPKAATVLIFHLYLHRKSLMVRLPLAH